MFGQAGVPTDGVERCDHILGDHLIAAFFFDRLGGQEDGVADEEPIGPGHARILALVAAGDHDTRGNLHLTQEVASDALLVRLVGDMDSQRQLENVHLGDAGQGHGETVGAAIEHDESSGVIDWVESDESKHFDYASIRRRLERLRRLQRKGDHARLLFALNEGIHGNMGGMGRASLIGGEPLLQQHLLHWISQAKQAGCNTGFLTNGMLLNNSIAEQLAELGPDWIGFSMDGADKSIEKCEGGIERS